MTKKCKKQQKQITKNIAIFGASGGASVRTHKYQRKNKKKGRCVKVREGESEVCARGIRVEKHRADV